MEQSTSITVRRTLEGWLRGLSRSDFIAIDIIITATIATFLIPGGADLYNYYLQLGLGNVEVVYNPWHAVWIFYPLRLIPLGILYPAWVLFTGVGLFWASKRLGTSPLIVMASFPMFGLVWLGQADVLIVLGLLLMLLSKNPYVRGFGLLLTTYKPQVTGPAILLLLLRDEAPIKTMILPLLVFLASLVVWGYDWPLRWLTFILTTPASYVWGSASLFPVGLLAFAVVPLFREKRQQLTAILLAIAVGVPRVGVYSYVVFLVLLAPWWALPVSYLWMLAWPLMGVESMMFAGVLPVSLLVYLTWPVAVKRWPQLKKLALGLGLKGQWALGETTDEAQV